MKHAYNHYPSHIAKILAFEVDLLSDMETDYMVKEHLQSEIDKLIEFQQMSLVSSFEDCLVVYYEMDLSEDQIKNLKLIYEVTPKLLPAIMFEEAMDALDKERLNKKPDMSVIANLFHTAIDKLTMRERISQ